MATYRERREAKAERLRGWAAKREGDAAALRKRNDPFRGDVAFFTQPGRVIERERFHARAEAAVVTSDKAAQMVRKADNIDDAADRAIYSDDPDARERLEERIAGLEAKRDTAKAANAAYRKEHRAELAAMTPYQRGEAVPHPSYSITNTTANIGRLKKRLAALDLPPVLRSVTARRDGECARCDDPIRAGTTITEAAPGEWVHVGCLDD